MFGHLFLVAASVAHHANYVYDKGGQVVAD